MTARLLTEEGRVIELDRSECTCRLIRHAYYRPDFDTRLLGKCPSCREREGAAANRNGDPDGDPDGAA